MSESYRMKYLERQYWELTTLNIIPESHVVNIRIEDNELRITGLDKIVTKRV